MATSIKRTTPQSFDFDDGRLEALSEPITVSVWKESNGQSMPIILPVKPDETVAGKGWTKDDIRELHEFLPVKWCGGGRYKLQATGDNGEIMRWKAYWPESEYPPMIPPPMRSQRDAEMGLSGAVPPMMAGQGPTPSFGWLGSYAVAPAPRAGASASPFQQMPPYGYYQGGPQFAPSPFGGNGASSTPFRSGVGSPDEKLMQEREERLKLEARLEREKQEAAHRADMAKMQDELRRLHEQANSRPAESEAVKALNEKINMLEQQNSSQVMLAAMRENAQTLAQALAEQKRDSDRRFEELTRQLNDSSRQQPDQMMVFLMQSQQAQAQANLEAQRESARTQLEIAKLQAEAQRESSRNAFSLRDMAELMKGNGTEQMMNVLQGAWQMNQQAIEAMIASQGPGLTPGMQMLGQSVEAGTALVQRYIEMKEEESKNETRAKAMEAQARVIALQRSAAPPQQLAEAMAESDEATEAADEVDRDIKEKERELFGPALPVIQRMREQVLGGEVTPEQVAQMVVEGVQHVAAQKIHIPAFDAWVSGELGHLVDALLPDVPQSYRLAVEEQLITYRDAMIRQAQAAARSNGQAERREVIDADEVARQQNVPPTPASAS